MAMPVDFAAIVKHIIYGTLHENLCRVCLAPLDDFSKNIFTKVCREDTEYCVADVLYEVCNVKIEENEQFNICSDCFRIASAAYKFYLLTKRSDEILNFFVRELENNINLVDIPDNVADQSLFISLPGISLQTKLLNSDIKSFTSQHSLEDGSKIDHDTISNSFDSKTVFKSEIKHESESDSEIILFKEENKDLVYLKVLPDGNLEVVDPEDGDLKVKHKNKVKEKVHKKIRRKRLPMSYKLCSECPVKYRFITKLKEHMKMEHNINLNICKICQALFEDDLEFQHHLKTHTDVHTCAICNVAFKRRATIIYHLKKHEEMKNISLDKVHVCEICGQILATEDNLNMHYDKTHNKKYTCHYCGRMYKRELSFDLHIKKHEMHMKTNKVLTNDIIKRELETKDSESKLEDNKVRFTCSTCERSFVDERALMWHNRLHTNERPYKCDVCGRGFVSLNRRNQHAMCSHSAPARRCPLCPALFHMRSMVNTHIKKVHLKEHKRKTRCTKYQEVNWRTETVPIGELSMSIQNDILQLQTAQKAIVAE